MKILSIKMQNHNANESLNQTQINYLYTVLFTGENINVNRKIHI